MTERKSPDILLLRQVHHPRRCVALRCLLSGTVGEFISRIVVVPTDPLHLNPSLAFVDNTGQNCPQSSIIASESLSWQSVFPVLHHVLILIHHRLVVQTNHNILFIWGRHHCRYETHKLDLGRGGVSVCPSFDWEMGILLEINNTESHGHLLCARVDKGAIRIENEGSRIVNR